jgi:hypothetical protein
MDITCPHCKETVALLTRPNQTIAGCTKCNGTFKVEVLNPNSNKSSIVPEPNELKVLCPGCSRKILMPDSMLNTDIVCPDCHNPFTALPKHVIFTVEDSRVSTGQQLKTPVPVPTAPASAPKDVTNNPTVAPKPPAGKKTNKTFKMKKPIMPSANINPQATQTLVNKPEAVAVRPKK